jgi:basic amino acid/polyamine antiporter, APA family
VSTGSEETKRPQRDLPIAIVGSLVIATILYILVSVAAVGASELGGQDAPLAVAPSEGAGIDWGADIVTFGALVAITSVVLTILYGQTRVAYAMCRDGLMPERLSNVWRSWPRSCPSRRSPSWSTSGRCSRSSS